jgi:hypothetical protein
MPMGYTTEVVESNIVPPILSRKRQVRCMAGGYSDFGFCQLVFEILGIAIDT